MANTNTPRHRVIGFLAAFFVLIFAGFIGWEYWGADRGQPASGSKDLEQAVVDHGEAVTAFLEVPGGTVELALWPALAPKHITQLTTLISQGFYDGVVFHRVIDGFMAQTGDPTGTGTGGSDLPDIPAEFSDAKFVRGTLGMARSQNPDSANSQFFITFGDTPFLEGDYTVFGQVVAGMEYIDAIKKGDPQSGLMSDPDRIISLRIAE